MKNIKEYIKTRIKDRELAEKVIDVVTSKKCIFSLDLADVREILDRAKDVKFAAGCEECITDNIESPEKVTAVMMLIESSNTEPDHIGSIGEKVTENLFGNEVDVIWSAKENKKLSKAKVSAVVVY